MNSTFITKEFIYQNYNGSNGIGRTSSTSSSSVSQNYLWLLTWPVISLLFIICCYIFICVRKSSNSKRRDHTLDDTYGYHDIGDDIFRSSNNVEEEQNKNSYVHVSKSDLSV